MHKLKTLLLLMVAYAAATWFAQPGLWMRDISMGLPFIKPPEVLLAIMLFCAGLCSSEDAIRDMWQSHLRIVKMVIASLIVPLLSAVIALSVIWGLMGGPPSVALGILIIAAMPIANASVSWSTHLGGNVTLSIALLVSATAVSPLLAPLVISSGAYWIGSSEQSLSETPWSSGMALFFLFWVLMPVAFGVLLARPVRIASRGRIMPVVKQISFSILILLNYLNGAACLPVLTEDPALLLWPIAGAATLLLCSQGQWRILSVASFGHKVAQIASSTDRDRADRTSLVLAVMMRNTGAALVFAGAALPDYALISITIISYTLLQHLWVAFALSPIALHSDIPALAPGQQASLSE